MSEVPLYTPLRRIEYHIRPPLSIVGVPSYPEWCYMRERQAMTPARACGVQGYLAHKKPPPPQGPP